MNEVKVNREKLLTILIENRTTHQKVFDEALEGYKTRVVEILERQLADARAGKRIPEYVHIPRPVNQTHEYNRAIRMMELSVEPEIVLTTQQFDQYVMDKWHWKQDFLSKNSAYSVTATMMAASEAEDSDA